MVFMHGRPSSTDTVEWTSVATHNWPPQVGRNVAMSYSQNDGGSVLFNAQDINLCTNGWSPSKAALQNTHTRWLTARMAGESMTISRMARIPFPRIYDNFFFTQEAICLFFIKLFISRQVYILMQLWEIIQKHYICPLAISCKTLGQYHNRDVGIDVSKIVTSSSPQGFFMLPFYLYTCSLHSPLNPGLPLIYSLVL